ncbi:MAG TPA: prephenate dehydratase domain-containing protein [Gemmatimonadaceae bacterium]|nr:prephenate dehydratase domain-containing protein [Gemmatimonadaceae bacterium]
MPTLDPADTPYPAPAPAARQTLARVRVAFQGELGAFSEEAVHLLWRGEAAPVPVATFEDVMEAAETERVDYGLLPLESTLVGGLDAAYDLLSLHDGLCIVAEVIVPVHLCLLALPGAKLRELRTLASHPVMLGQCSHFLARHREIVAQPAWDTAGAAREVSEAGDRTRAAAGTRRAAERFGLEVLMEDIEDRPDSQMRFLAVGREPVSVVKGMPARTAALCVLPHAAGALVSAVQPMAAAGFNICHLATRPTREPWRYQFFLEFEHPAGDPRVAESLAAIRRASAEYRFLGTYPRWPHTDEQRENGLAW